MVKLTVLMLPPHIVLRKEQKQAIKADHVEKALNSFLLFLSDTLQTISELSFFIFSEVPIMLLVYLKL